MRTKDIQELLYKSNFFDDVNYDVSYSEIVAKAYYEGFIKTPFLATELEEEFLELIVNNPAAKPHNWKEPSGTHWSPSLYATMAFYVKHPIECGKALNRFKPSVVGELITSYKGEDEFILELMHAEKLAFDHEYIAYSSKYFYVKKRIPELWEYVCWKNGVKADGAYDAIKKLWLKGGRYKQYATDVWWLTVVGEFFTNNIIGEMPADSLPYDPGTEKPISPKGLKWLAKMAGGPEVKFSEAVGLPMLNLFRLFGNNIQAYQHIGAVDYWKIHDLGQFNLPKGKIDPVWGNVVLAKPTLKPYLSNIREIEEVLGRPPRDHKEVTAILEGPLKDSIGFGQEWGVFLSKAEIADYNRLFECGGKSAEFLPQVRGEYNGLTIRKLNAHEKMGPLIGRLSGCCQHLHGAARDCAVKTYTDPTMGVYVVEDSRNKQLVAQTFAYRTLCDSIVLDSVESRSIYEDKAADVAKLIKMAFDDVVKRQTMCVRQVVIGNTSYGMTQDVVKHIKGGLKSNLQEIRKLDYKDSSNWKVVAENPEIIITEVAVNEWVDQARELDQSLYVNRPNDEYDWDDLEYDEEDEN